MAFWKLPDCHVIFGLKLGERSQELAMRVLTVHRKKNPCFEYQERMSPHLRPSAKRSLGAFARD
jgi:hypothetical protein